MSDDEETMMIVVPSTWNHTPESILTDADCGHRCWATPNAIEFCQVSANTTMRCFPCAAQDLLDDLDKDDIVQIPEWAKHMVEGSSMDEVKDFLRQMAASVLEANG